MRIWLSGPRIGFVRPGISFSLPRFLAEGRAPTATRYDDFVYVVEGGGMVKVGRSTNPAARLASLQTSSAFPLTLAHTMSTGRAFEVEQRAHGILGRYRLQGEWFDCAPDVAVAAIHAAAFQVGRDTPRDPHATAQSDLSFLDRWWKLIFFLVAAVLYSVVAHFARAEEMPAPGLDFQSHCREFASRRTGSQAEEAYAFCMKQERDDQALLKGSARAVGRPDPEATKCQERLKATGSYHLIRLCIQEHWLGD